jgi:hypothetical protein
MIGKADYRAQEGTLRIAALLFALAIAACTSAPEVPARRIEEKSWLAIGGIEQWITIRGGIG